MFSLECRANATMIETQRSWVSDVLDRRSRLF